MKKILIIVLLAVTVPLYSYNAWLLMRAMFPGAPDRAAAAQKGASRSFEQLLLAATPVRFEHRGRDPFTLYRGQPKPPPAAKAVVQEKKPPQKAISPPPLTITGILWNPDNPVAMIKLPGGSKTLAKAGQRIGDNLTIKCVGKKSVTVVFEGKEFTIGR